MGKKLGGAIISVLLLQIAFQILTAAERVDLAYSRIQPVSGVWNAEEPIADMPAYAAGDFPAENDPVRTHLATLRKLEPEPRKAVRAVYIIHKEVRAASKRVLRSETAVYRPASVPGPLLQTNAVRIQPETSTTPHHLIAKVLPVIKKPYDWLKSVGSLFH